MTISPELTMSELKYLRDCIHARGELINHVMADSISLDERLELSAQYDLGGQLAMRFAVLISIADSKPEDQK